MRLRRHPQSLRLLHLHLYHFHRLRLVILSLDLLHRPGYLSPLDLPVMECLLYCLVAFFQPLTYRHPAYASFFVVLLSYTPQEGSYRNLNLEHPLHSTNLLRWVLLARPLRHYTFVVNTGHLVIF